MRITKSTARLNMTNALLMSLAMGIVGMPMAMASDVATDSKTTAYEESEAPVTDTWITTKVKADLLVTEEVKGLDINVSTINGVVTLAGLLDSQAQHDKAIAIAKAIKGVKSVEAKALKLKPAK
ncbi:MAG: BON domain-containing protein [Arenimonas sp.]